MKGSFRKLSQKMTAYSNFSSNSPFLLTILYDCHFVSLSVSTFCTNFLNPFLHSVIKYLSAFSFLCWYSWYYFYLWNTCLKKGFQSPKSPLKFFYIACCTQKTVVWIVLFNISSILFHGQLPFFFPLKASFWGLFRTNIWELNFFEN